METTEKLKKGYKEFQEKYFQEYKDMYLDLCLNGQKPKTLLISCSDSRVDPSIILQTEPGELFAVRNVGNLVPPYKVDDSHHGVSSALEYGVNVLQVENIMIMGHAHCGAIQAAIDTENNPDELGTEFVHNWVRIAQDTFKNPQCCAASINAGNRNPHEVEQASIVNSMKNLETFPFIKKRIEEGSLKIYGLYFHIETGELSAYDRKTGEFGPL
ncbi:carbonic anhydrase [Terasakiella sp. A23]|uniref:carbonic anhydrase n=1 Tax=Terasakiella sp. FCG-A23 TaxID=3080561 RepID=UPI002955D171|nr:carbonic anhydrase [Terasakiella sp. A23]MDV7337956.1 carbonic anhydrase [Terasakiella sp. A23]